jgi:hypothetical protein
MAQSSGIVGVFDKFWALIVSPVLTLLMGIATVLFFYGLIIYLSKASDASKQSEGRLYMLYGIIGFAIMAAANPIVRVICQFFSSDCNIGV